MNLIWQWPQIVMAGILAFGIIRTIAKLGEPKKPDTYDMYDLIATGISVWILYCGGFFTGGQ